MLEQQRIEYLQAMGIQLWMPREALPDAADSLWLANDLAERSNGGQEPGTAVQAGHAADLLAGMGFGDSAKNENINKAANLAEDAQSNTTGLAPVSHDASVAGNKTLEQATLENEASVQGTSSQSVSQNTTVSDAISEADVSVVDLTVPRFELHFALWPCGILWVSEKPFEQKDHVFQTAVSYSLLGNTVPQANYSQFKWPYIEGSNEDQGMAVALRALTAQWEFMSGQGARGWVALDESSYAWLAKVTAKPLYAVESTDELFTIQGKKQLWQALQSLPAILVS